MRRLDKKRDKERFIVLTVGGHNVDKRNYVNRSAARHSRRGKIELRWVNPLAEAWPLHHQLTGCESCSAQQSLTVCLFSLQLKSHNIWRGYCSSLLKFDEHVAQHQLTCAKRTHGGPRKLQFTLTCRCDVTSTTLDNDAAKNFTGTSLCCHLMWTSTGLCKFFRMFFQTELIFCYFTSVCLAAFV